MNSETFYKEIGNIDDDLILAASEAHGYDRRNRRKTIFYSIAGIAACLCLICGGIFFGLKEDVIYINGISSPITNAKFVVPSDEGTKTVVMTYQELLSYYGIERLPGDLENGLTMVKQSYFAIYRDRADKVISDTNILYYNGIDGNKSLSVTLAISDKLPGISDNDIKRSKLDGTSVILASPDREEYWAGFMLNGISVNITSHGLNEEEFVNTVKEMIKSLK